jgi:hypothetical protein
MVETPEGTLTIELSWMKMTGVDANLTLYGTDGWKTEKRYWAEHINLNPERDEDESLAQVVSEWAGMPLADAEAWVNETVSRWRRSSAFDYNVKIGHQSKLLMIGLAVVAVLALVGVAALVWLVVELLT